LHGNEGIHVVAYEDLTSEKLPEVMMKICAFLDLPYSPEVLRPSIFGEPVVVKTSSRSTTEVFSDQKHWYDDLNLREKLIVCVVSKLMHI
jgi:hypothetical protein